MSKKEKKSDAITGHYVEKPKSMPLPFSVEMVTRSRRQGHGVYLIVIGQTDLVG